MLLLKFYKKRILEKSRSGFTLIELTLSLTVFLIFLGIIMRSFISLLGVQIEANRYRKVYAEVEQVVRIMRSDMRDYAIDYECFTLGSCQASVNTGSEIQQKIAFVSGDSLRKVDYLIDYTGDEPKISRQEGSRNSLDSEFVINSATDLDLASAYIQGLYLNVSPKTDPFDFKNRDFDGIAEQPKIDLALSVVPKSYPERSPLSLQTTITSRFYKSTSK